MRAYLVAMALALALGGLGDPPQQKPAAQHLAKPL